jgi:hypothetical protein
MNYQYFENPLNSGPMNANSGPMNANSGPMNANSGPYRPAYCPYVKINNPFKNDPVSQPRTIDGKTLDKVCVPNLSDRMYIPGYGYNYCENGKPVHLNFYDKSACYHDSQCLHKINTCYDPYMQ